MTKASIARLRLAGTGTFLLASLFCFEAFALDPSKHISQYAHNVWTNQGGQIPGAVFAITQTKDGNLWVGTEFGLFRFDGNRFINWQPPQGEKLNSAYITALTAARDGSLWVGMRDALAHLKTTHLEVFPTKNAGGSVADILEDHQGTVWVATVGYQRGGLCQVREHALDCHPIGEPGLAQPGVVSLFESRQGDLWAGGIGVLRSLTSHTAKTYRGRFTSVDSITGDSAGDIWIATNEEVGVSHLVGDRFEPAVQVSAGIHPRVLMHDRDGGLWIGTKEHGLRHFNKGHFDDFRHSDGLSHDDVRCLFEDREGTIWAGTTGGLDSFRDYAVTTMSAREGLAADVVSSVAPRRNGGVWVGTARGVNRIEQGNITLLNRRNGLPSDAISAIFEDKAGRLWIDSEKGVVTVEGDHVAVPFALSDKMRQITAAAEDGDGTIWLSDHALGLTRVPSSGAAETVPWAVFQGKQAWTMEPDPLKGGLWLGFAQGGVAFYKPGQKPQWYDAGRGLPEGLVADLHMTKDQQLWVATENGLALIQGDTIAKLDDRHGLPCNRIHAIVEDLQGALWLNTVCGLVRINATDLFGWSRNTKSKVKVRLFDSQDGMPVRALPSGHFRRAARSSDGRLWFVAVSGLAVIDPQHIRENLLPPPVEIEEITADHKTYDPASSVTLPPDPRDIEIDYAALTFVAAPKVRYRYRLQGFDPDWKDVGGRRQAVYTKLPPKQYRFQVIAANNDGVWNEIGASKSFRIQPSFTETVWFYLLCGLAVLAMAWAGMQFRFRQLENRLNVSFEARLKERNRIARELHDTIVQNITGVSLELQGLAKTVTASPDRARNKLTDLRVEVEQWLQDLRKLLWDLRRQIHADVDLRTAFERAGQEVIMEEPVILRIVTSGRVCPTTPFVQEQIVRIFQEALRNAMRHGHAQHVNVRLIFKRRKWVHVRVRDDGSGFDPADAPKTGHCGLVSMRERADQMGGELKIHSAPGKGTEIEIMAPVGASGGDA